MLEEQPFIVVIDRATAIVAATDTTVIEQTVDEVGQVQMLHLVAGGSAAFDGRLGEPVRVPLPSRTAAERQDPHVASLVVGP
jgi:hypothetical protein